MELTDKDINFILTAIYSGRITPTKLPKKLYLKIAQYLEGGVYEGYGKTLYSIQYGTTDFNSLAELRDNVYLFSAAKTFNYILDTEGLLYEGEKLLSFKDFKERALLLNDKYNKLWLEAEYNTTIQQSKNVASWNEIQDTKDVLPLLRYVAVIDANTSEICKSINGIVKPVDDAFWKVYAPANHYRCRCHLESLQLGGAVVSNTPKNLIKPSEAFAFNPGEKSQVFTKEHPYFADIPKEYKSFAKTNFGLPLPKPVKK